MKKLFIFSFLVSFFSFLNAQQITGPQWLLPGDVVTYTINSPSRYYPELVSGPFAVVSETNGNRPTITLKAMGSMQTGMTQFSLRIYDDYGNGKVITSDYIWIGPEPVFTLEGPETLVQGQVGVYRLDYYVSQYVTSYSVNPERAFYSVSVDRFGAEATANPNYTGNVTIRVDYNLGLRSKTIYKYVQIVSASK